MYGLKPANDATHSEEAQSGSKLWCLHHCLLFLPEVLEDIHQKVLFSATLTILFIEKETKYV